MTFRRLRTAALAVIASAILTPYRAVAAVPEYTGVVVRHFPHDPNAFTEGLLYRNGHLYEGTGRNGHSSIREVVLETGTVTREKDLDARYYGEGIVIWGNRLIELTWRNELGFIYDLRTFRPLSSFAYQGEGWGLTEDGVHLIMSNGTDQLRLLDPNTLRETDRIQVACDGRAVHLINEIEWVKGEIFANIWRTNLIARINPRTGEVVGLIDLTDLAPGPIQPGVENVLNGIAYDAATNRLFVTGKLWPTLYQITLAPRPERRNLCAALP